MALLFPAGYNFDTAAGRLFIFENETTTPATVYTDELLTTAHDHPIILDSSGRCGNIYVTDGSSYTVQLTDSSAAEVWSRNDVWGVLKTPDTTVIADATYQIPTDYSTLQAAVDALSPRQGVNITLNIEAGHQLTSGLTLQNGDWSMFTITSTDATVTVASTFTGDVLFAENARCPVFDTVVDMNSTGDDGLWVARDSSLIMTAGSGISNSNGIGLYVGSSSYAKCDETVWDGCGRSGVGTDRTIFVTRTSRCSLQEATISNSQSPDAAIYISRNSQVFASLVTISDSLGNGVWCHRGSEYVAQSSTISNPSKNGIFAQRASTIDVNNSTFTAITDYAIESIGGVVCCEGLTASAETSPANDDAGLKASAACIMDARNVTLNNFDEGIWAKGASRVSAAGCDINNSLTRGVFAEEVSTVDIDAGSVTGSGSTDLAVNNGSVIQADGCTTENGVGTPAVGDCNVSSFNAIDGSNGIIWD